MINFLLPVLVFGVSYVVASVINRMSLRAWRRTVNQHWTERARFSWPARVTAAQLVFFVPGILVVGTNVLWPKLNGAVWIMNALFGALGAALATWHIARELFPRLTYNVWLEDWGAGLVLRWLPIAVWLLGMRLMPLTPCWQMALVAGGVVVFKLWYMLGGVIWLGRLLRVFKPAPPEVYALVEEVAGELSAPMPMTWIIGGSSANALALPLINNLIVTEPIVAIAPREELKTILAHEFGHLGEPRSVLAVRVLTAWILFPLLFLGPIIHLWSSTGIFVVIGFIFGLAKASGWFRKKMERRADALAKSHEKPDGGTGVYARALERLYEYNQTPAVLGRKNPSHPDLYDRMIQAGVVPDYARPSPPPGRSWVIVGFIVIFFVMIFMSAFSDSDSASEESSGQLPVDVRDSEEG